MSAAVAPTGVALVGTGDMGTAYARALAAVTDAALHVVAGSNAERAGLLAAEHAARLIPDYDTALADEAVEAVVLCVPNDLHRAFAERAFAAGKHVLCEKPIALTLDDADAMIDAARRANRFLMVGLVLRFWEEYREAARLLQSGELGRVWSLNARRVTSVLRETAGSRQWRRAADRSGGAVIDLLVHDLDFACWLFGPPQGVVARGVRSSYGSFDHVAVLLDYGSERVVLVEAGFMLAAGPPTIGFQLLGDCHTLSYSVDARGIAVHTHAAAMEKGGPGLMRFGRDGSTTVLTAQRPDAFAEAVREQAGYFVRCVRDGTELQWATAHDARLALALATAARTACETGSPVPGPFRGGGG